jgi:uncharacterized damage-inducible protein DinB
MNPYASHLGSRNPHEVIESTYRKLHELIQALGPDGAEQSLAPGKWTVREIVTHLADCEITFAFRLRQTVAEPDHVIQPFDQEAWSRSYSGYDIEQALATFAAVRAWNIAFLRSLPEETFAKKVTHPERGEMTLRIIVETMGGHDLNHLAQVETIARRSRASATA